ncbi:DUF3574 domain-containing protein [Streptomyces sp. ISL-44]|uniref:DUF3574 domain-containing protein n=1 Tax=unclassified Streptomyces TaxID=2593676 RepID=UPI001BE96C11|nr:MULTISPECIES: DUF3574 domain-containing protein [unclassified Streptomyces]MBT2542269.1 DUF3574 domain-containing protein [Streptomyces sp. ISL-44]MCX5012356.1 DUF3574 domain-containing protein [Streptomyces sp. NBC_00555]MCX5606321.1 DUF3574 domain-containing protein [Streptomyces sp. NBC_00047]UUU40567.1 DUF3574 domain-containing protein [Streptomyces sp. NBC_00162]
MRGKVGGGVLIALLGAGIPALVGAALHTDVGQPYQETRLYFGTDRSDGGSPVGEREFMRFLDREITPAFPEGLTVHDGYGQWRGQDGKVVRETSYEVVLLYPEKEAGERSGRIERIRQAYEDQYQQDSVGRSDDKLTAEF